MIRNPFKLDPRAESYGYPYYSAVLAGAALLSVVGNVTAFAADELNRYAVWAIHGLPPLIAVLMIHMFSTIRASFMGSIRCDPAARPVSPWAGLSWRERRRSWSFGDLALAVVLVLLVTAVVAITLAVSFVSLAKVGEMAGWQGRATWALPLMLDLPAFAATIGFIKAGHRMTEDERNADAVLSAQIERRAAAVVEFSSTTIQDDPATIRTPGDPAIQPSIQDDPVGWIATDDPADELLDPTIQSGDPVVDRGTGPQVDPVDRAGDGRSTAGGSLTPETDDPAIQGDPATIHTPGDPAIQPSMQDDPLGWIEADDPAGEAIQSGDPVVDRDLWDLADRVRETLGTDVDRDTIQRALGLDAEGQSRRRIGEQLGVAHSTVGRWIKAAKKLADDGPVLAVVGGEPTD